MLSRLGRRQLYCACAAAGARSTSRAVRNVVFPRIICPPPAVFGQNGTGPLASAIRRLHAPPSRDLSCERRPLQEIDVDRPAPGMPRLSAIERKLGEHVEEARDLKLPSS